MEVTHGLAWRFSEIHLRQIGTQLPKKYVTSLKCYAFAFEFSFR